MKQNFLLLSADFFTAYQISQSEEKQFGKISYGKKHGFENQKSSGFSENSSCNL